MVDKKRGGGPRGGGQNWVNLVHVVVECSLKGSSMKKHPKQFNCNDCRGSFIGKVDLQRHINAVHLKMKPYECDQCHKSFNLKGSFKKHMNAVHLKRKPYECD